MSSRRRISNMKLALISTAATLVLAFIFPITALADINSTATINAGGNFNFDAGTNVASGGDISFSGTSITFVGTAKGGALTAVGLVGSAGFTSATPTIL